MLVALKVMPGFTSMETTTKSTVTLFGRTNFQLQNTLFQQSSLSAMHFYQWWTRACMPQSQNLHGHPEHGLSLMSLSPLLSPSTASLCSHPLSGLRKTPAKVDECQWVPFFSAWRNSMRHLCFIHTFMWDTIASECPSTAVCQPLLPFHQYSPLTSQ